MALMEVLLQQRYGAQTMLNRWNYIASGTPLTVNYAFALANALGAIPAAAVYPSGEMMDLISKIQGVGVAFEQLVCKNVYDPTEFYEVPFVDPLAGTIAGDGSARFIAIGFRTTRTRLDIRRGTKRFGGIATASLDSGGDIDNTLLAGAVADLAAKMSETLEYVDGANTLTFQPCIVKKLKYAVPGSDPTRYAYKYYPTEEDQLDYVMTSITWEAYDQARSQVSRQIGKGV